MVLWWRTQSLRVKILRAGPQKAINTRDGGAETEIRQVRKAAQRQKYIPKRQLSARHAGEK